MLLVVFGAGASYDSAPTYRPEWGGRAERPPPASQLFTDKPRFAFALQEFSECQPLVPFLRHPPGGVTVEELLQKYQEEASSDSQRYPQLAAIRYYLQRILGSDQQNEWDGVHRGVTNYKTLLEELRHWRLSSGEKVCLVTFNYDTMLEAASGVVGVHIKDISDYVSNENYKIIKVHGSVHWVRELNTPVDGFSTEERGMIHGLIERAATLDISNRFHISHTYWPAELPRRNNKRIGVVPAIAIPVVSKSSFECPEEHLNVLLKSLSEVTKIMTIGWRAKEEHFLDLLSKQPGQGARVMVVANDENEAKQICLDLSQRGIGREFFQARGGFSNTIVISEISQFLIRQ